MLSDLAIYVYPVVVLCASRIIPKNRDGIIGCIARETFILNFFQRKPGEYCAFVLLGFISLIPMPIGQADVLLEPQAHPLQAIWPTTRMHP